MRTYVNIATHLLFALILISFFGCGKKADQTSPASQAKAEAQKLNVKQLRDKALSVRKVLLEKKAEVEQLAAKLAKLPSDQMIGKEGQAIRQQMGELQKSMSELYQQLRTCRDKLKENGADVSGLDM